MNVEVEFLEEGTGEWELWEGGGEGKGVVAVGVGLQESDGGGLWREECGELPDSPEG